MTINAKTHRRLFKYPNGVIYEYYGTVSKKSRPNRLVKCKPLNGNMARRDYITIIPKAKAIDPVEPGDPTPVEFEATDAPIVADIAPVVGSGEVT